MTSTVALADLDTAQLTSAPLEVVAQSQIVTIKFVIFLSSDLTLF